MREVTTAPAALGRPRTTALDRLRTIALATALACTASGAHANFASVVIQWPFRQWQLQPRDASSSRRPTPGIKPGFFRRRSTACPSRQNANSVPNWAPVDARRKARRRLPRCRRRWIPTRSRSWKRLALRWPRRRTPYRRALYTALGNMLTSGSFCFWDSLAPTPPDFDGTSAFCNGSGSLTFTLFYDLIVNTSFGPPNSAYAELNVLGTGVPGGFFFDFASTALGNASKLDESFSWTAVADAPATPHSSISRESWWRRPSPNPVS